MSVLVNGSGYSNCLVVRYFALRGEENEEWNTITKCVRDRVKNHVRRDGVMDEAMTRI